MKRRHVSFGAKKDNLMSPKKQGTSQSSEDSFASGSAFPIRSPSISTPATIPESSVCTPPLMGSSSVSTPSHSTTRSDRESLWKWNQLEAELNRRVVQLTLKGKNMRSDEDTTINSEQKSLKRGLKFKKIMARTIKNAKLLASPRRKNSRDSESNAQEMRHAEQAEAVTLEGGTEESKEPLNRYSIPRLSDTVSESPKSMNGIYWVPDPASSITPIQSPHAHSASAHTLVPKTHSHSDLARFTETSAEIQQLWLDELRSAICQAKVRAEMAGMEDQLTFSEQVPAKLSQPGFSASNKPERTRRKVEPDGNRATEEIPPSKVHGLDITGSSTCDDMSVSSIELLLNWLTCSAPEPNASKFDPRGMVITASLSFEEGTFENTPTQKSKRSSKSRGTSRSRNSRGSRGTRGSRNSRRGNRHGRTNVGRQPKWPQSPKLPRPRSKTL